MIRPAIPCLDRAKCPNSLLGHHAQMLWNSRLDTNAIEDEASEKHMLSDCICNADMIGNQLVCGYSV